MDMTAIASDIDAVSCGYSYQEYKKAKCMHTWVIKGFSLICDDDGSYIDSGKFFIGTNSAGEWNMRLYPYDNTISFSSTKYLKINVMFRGSGTVKATCRVWVVGEDNLKAKEQAITAQMFSKDISWSTSLGSRSEFLEGSEGLLPGDVLTLCCELTVVDLRQSSGACAVQNPPRGSTFMDDFTRLFKHGDFVDVTLIAEGEEVHVHKNVLAMRSPVFDAMFENNMKEKQENRVDLEDMSAEVLRQMVTFIYTDTAPNIDSLAVDLLHAAEKYDMKRLKSMCECSLASTLTVDTAVEVLRLALKLNAVNLRKFVMSYINAHAVDVGRTEGWKAMVEEEAHLLELFTPIGRKTE